MHLQDIFPADDLNSALCNGFIRRQAHPDLPYVIYNYTEKCQFDGKWDDVTRQCRGLIVREDDVIIARPWAKFFNYGQPEAGPLDLAAPAEVTDKMDGSLGICYPVPDGYAIATRGSFASDQALHATDVLWTRYAGFRPPPGATVLWEIIYKKNRIVLDYGELDDLVLLGGVDIATGEDVPLDGISWPGPRTSVFSASTLAEALAISPRGMEGVVVRMLDSGVRVKIKEEKYVALHRLITGMNARVIWERLGAGETADGICSAIPEEFWPWVKEVAAELEKQRDSIFIQAHTEHMLTELKLPDGWTRKDYALAVKDSEVRPWLFLLLDGKDPLPKIWHTLRPSAERSLTAYSEDTT